MNKGEGSQAEGATTAAGEKASASPAQLLSPAAPRRRLFQFQDGEEQEGFLEKHQNIWMSHLEKYIYYIIGPLTTNRLAWPSILGLIRKALQSWDSEESEGLAEKYQLALAESWIPLHPV